MRLVQDEQQMTVPELRAAAAALCECPMQRDMAVLTARLRVAFQLEKLGA
ncbi:hypothetical protein GCU56_18735 [Geodermatophilus sabuli]|uniref:Uncharacterized protein n=1 Tax=Geodermatophilus sabuli TaxID=1564158 RepID=A0A7K3W4T0_9ACTN|nr:hypothetical protein [Geodermatophilus sabuli]NEK59895.1 hypothetical protein [Geodermatophilus sabuli]